MAHKVSKKGKARSFRPSRETDKLLDEYMAKHEGAFNETDIIDASIRCFLSNQDCIARVMFERDHRIKSK